MQCVPRDICIQPNGITNIFSDGASVTFYLRDEKETKKLAHYCWQTGKRKVMAIKIRKKNKKKLNELNKQIKKKEKKML